MSSLPTSGTISKFDIIAFAQDVMAEIEHIRSYTPSFNDELQQSDQRPTESRVNAFFRLMGLPMFVSVSPDNDKGKSTGSNASQIVMTPGFRQGILPKNSIIANSKMTKLFGPDGKQSNAQALLDMREQELLERERSIGATNMNTRMALAFYFPMDLKLNENTNDKDGFIIFKRVSPFAVSYDTIFPGSNELSKPFLVNLEDGRPSPSSTPIRKPFIETAIRIRMVAFDGGNQGLTDYLDSARTRMAQLSQQAADMLPQESSLYESYIIDQMLGSIDQLADKWVKLQNRRQRIAKNVAMVLKPKTISSQRSPFGKRGNLATELQVQDNSATGQRLAALNQALAASEAMFSLLPTEDTTSLSGSTVRNVMPNALTNAFVSIMRQPIDQQRKKIDELNSQLTAQAQQADALRLEQEMMTGEFSGLSMPDIIFSILGLFLIDREDLIALLDSDTKDQMRQDPVLNTVIQTYDGGNSADAAIWNLEQKVEDLYDTLKTAIDLRIQRSKRTAKGSLPLATSQSDFFVDPQSAADEIAADGE